MSKPVDRMLQNAIELAEGLREQTAKAREDWSAFESCVFDLLLRAGIRPLFLRSQQFGEKLFRLDWVERTISEVTPIAAVIVEIADIARFGNLVGNDNTGDSTEESADVSGIASTF